MNQQLALAIQLNDEATFDDFHWSNANALLKQCILDLLKNQNHERFLYVWGGGGSGKSHLLQACCQTLAEGDSIYLPIDCIKSLGPSILEGVENHRLLCIDNIDAIAGLLEWEKALFHLYNRVRESQTSTLLVTGNLPSTHVAFQLPDLQSRLSWGLVLPLHELGDHEKLITLQHHAEKRGFELPNGVVQFLMSRCTRNMHDLHALLNKLDETSLAAQRKITIPFVKAALNL